MDSEGERRFPALLNQFHEPVLLQVVHTFSAAGHLDRLHFVICARRHSLIRSACHRGDAKWEPFRLGFGVLPFSTPSDPPVARAFDRLLSHAGHGVIRCGYGLDVQAPGGGYFIFATRGAEFAERGHARLTYTYARHFTARSGLQAAQVSPAAEAKAADPYNVLYDVITTRDGRSHSEDETGLFGDNWISGLATSRSIPLRSVATRNLPTES